MMRGLGTVAALALVMAFAGAQSINVFRPANGSNVREKVRFQIVKNGVPDSAYVGVYVNGRFVEATQLTKRGEFWEYILDTKGRGIADGKHTVEFRLFVDAGGRARALPGSSVEVNLQNTASIPVPDDGFLLRYNFTPGTELVYNAELSASVAMISENQARAGGRAAEIEVDRDRFRMLYGFDNRYPDGDGLVRMQAMPLPGKTSVLFRMVENAGGVEQGRRFYDFEMHPLYMRLTNTGIQEWGAVPLYVPIEGTIGEASRTDLYALFPLPTLPPSRVRPGSAWQAPFQQGDLDLNNLRELNTLVNKQQARGELVGVEWEMGHPCAKIRVSRDIGVGGTTGNQDLGDARIKVEQTIWFALDRRVPVRMELDITRDVKVQTTVPGFGGGVPQSGPAGFGGPGMPGGGGGGGAMRGDDSKQQRQGGRQGGRPGGFGGPPSGFPGGMPPGGPPAGFGGPAGPGGFGRPGLGQQAVQNQLTRVRTRISLTLAK